MSRLPARIVTRSVSGRPNSLHSESMNLCLVSSYVVAVLDPGVNVDRRMREYT